MTLAAILVLAIGTYAFRFTGPMLRDRLTLSARAERMMSLGAVAVLSALIATSALITDGGFAGWARAGGIAAGTFAAWRRLPFLVVVVVSAATAALLRLAGVR